MELGLKIEKLQDQLIKYDTKNLNQDKEVEVKDFKSQTEIVSLSKGSQTEVKLQDLTNKGESIIADKNTNNEQLTTANQEPSKIKKPNR